MKYRSEIDGIRALAVIPVILFHAGLNSFSGGFVGVDIFFVISGYLISSIIIQQRENHTFSLMSFYIRRARRILPGLILVLTVVYILSYFFYLPAEHKVVGQYIVSSILSVSNLLLYLKGSEYFGLSDASNPLYHTWSLGIEEQFYIFLPMFLIFVLRYGKFLSILIILFIASLSLTYSQSISGTEQTANFYLPFSRAWELLSGSLTALIIHKYGIQKSNILSFFGLVLIVYSIIFFNEKTPFPSLYTLIPILGVVLLIIFGERSTIIDKFLRIKPLIGIGLISYSLYLWHLPVQIYLDYLFHNSEYKFSSSLIIIFFLSVISYKFIELPFRCQFSNRFVLITIFIFSSILISFGVMGHLNGGYPERGLIFQNLKTNNGFGIHCNGNTFFNDRCSEDKYPDTVIFGDSYAMTWVESFAQNPNTSVLQLTIDSCAIGYKDTSKNKTKSCANFYKDSVNFISNSKNIKNVILSSRFEKELDDKEFLNSFNEILKKIEGRKITVIGPTPRAPFHVGKCILRKKILQNSDCDFRVSIEHREKIKLLRDTLKKIQGIEFIDLTDEICPNDRCLMSIGENDAMYIDNGHLSKSGSKKIFKSFIEKTKRWY